MLEIHQKTGPPDPITTADSDVVELDAKRYQYFCTLPNIFNTFPKLEKLNLSECSLYNLCPSLFTIKTLKSLDISKNNLSSIPFELGTLPNLVELKVEGNPFCRLLEVAKIAPENPNLIKILQKLCTKNPKPTTRTFKPDIPTSMKNTFLLFSYNILAPYTIRDDRFPLSLPKYLATEARIPLIKEQILEYPVSIVCLQEVEGKIYKETLEPFMKDRGFTSSYCQKGRAEKLDESGKETIHGEATFIRNSHFQVIKTIHIQYRSLINELRAANMSRFIPEMKKHDETAIISILQHKTVTTFVLVVVNVHLFWEPEKDIVRTMQLYLAIEAAKKAAQEVSQNFDIIIAGDFNSSTNSSTVEFLTQNALGFTNPYETFYLPPPFTVYTPTFSQTIDLIYHTTNFIRPVSVLAPYNEAEIKERYVAFPAEHFPSDHLPVAAYFSVHKKSNHPPSEQCAAIQVSKPEKKPFKIMVSPSQSSSTSSVQPASLTPSQAQPMTITHPDKPQLHVIRQSQSSSKPIVIQKK